MLKLPRNIYIMALVMAFSMSCASLMLLVSGLLATHIAPEKSLATLPLAVMVVGTALATIPASMLMQKIGRKLGMMFAVFVSMASALLAMWAAQNVSFTALLFASAGIGVNIAFMQTGRFAILESARDEKQQASGLSLALLAGLLSAYVGPQLGVLGKDLVAAPHGYAGSFLLFVGVQIITLVLLMLFKNPVIEQQENTNTGRPLLEIITKPAFIIAASSGAIGFGVMTLVMTATPISMHEFQHHSLDSTKWVIQSHMFAMFLPSLVTGMLIVRVNKILCLLLGLLVYVVVSFFAFQGHEIMHYWWALVLLGLGWNILFVTSTAMLPKAYEGNERFKVQACNDFFVFGFQALASFFAGWLLFRFGWSGVIWVLLVMTIPTFCLLALVYIRRKLISQTLIT
ncbi:MAG: MFS transporter [Arenicella sp.]